MFGFNNRFRLFGEESFPEFVRSNAIKIAAHIENISDETILGKAEDLDRYAAEISGRFSLPEVEFSFEKERVGAQPFMDTAVFDNGFERGRAPRAFMRYSFPIVKGKDLLRLCPFPYNYRTYVVEVSDDNKLVVVRDTGYATLDFPDRKVQEIRADGLSVKEGLIELCHGMNKAIGEYNASIFDFVRPRLDTRLAVARRNEKNKNDLNPF